MNHESRLVIFRDGHPLLYSLSSHPFAELLEFREDEGENANINKVSVLTHLESARELERNANEKYNYSSFLNNDRPFVQFQNTTDIFFAIKESRILCYKIVHH